MYELLPGFIFALYRDRRRFAFDRKSPAKEVTDEFDTYMEADVRPSSFEFDWLYAGACARGVIPPLLGIFVFKTAVCAQVQARTRGLFHICCTCHARLRFLVAITQGVFLRQRSKNGS